MTYEADRRKFRDAPPLRGTGPTSLNEARNELRRLMGILMKANKAYLLREETVIEMHRQGRQNYSGDLVTVMNNDLLLNNISGMSKTVSTLISGVSAYIQAEIAMKGQPLESLPCICGADKTPWVGHNYACRTQTGERT